MSDVVIYSKSDFESAKQHTDEGVEFWYARDLKDLLEYGQWRNFLNVVEKAKTILLTSAKWSRSALIQKEILMILCYHVMHVILLCRTEIPENK